MLKKRMIKAFTICLLFICLIAQFIFVKSKYRYTPKLMNSVDIGETKTNITNNYQNNASTWIGAYGGKLYFCPVKIAINNWKAPCVLYSVDDHSIRKEYVFRHGDRIKIIGQYGCYLYYWVNENKERALYGLNLNDMIETRIYTGNIGSLRLDFADDLGNVHIPLYTYGTDHTSSYLVVHDDRAVEINSLPCGYSIGEDTYYVSSASSFYNECVYKDEDGKLSEIVIPGGTAFSRVIVPCGESLVINQQGVDGMLYKIDKSGELIEMFSQECMKSESAIAIHDSDVYISVSMLDGFDHTALLNDKSPVPASKDRNGTYKVNLEDCTVTRISDRFYNGMYNLDDTCLICCDEGGCIYTVDFNGDEIEIINVD